jgi:hypothetical protein
VDDLVRIADLTAAAASSAVSVGSDPSSMSFSTNTWRITFQFQALEPGGYIECHFVFPHCRRAHRG